MNILIMSIKNIKKNFSFYTLYLLSVSLVITIFFTFTSFSMNNVMLEKISTDGRVESMCNVISIFLMIFVVFYMSYSNHFFLRRRTKEMGIYALLGYRKSTILSLLTYENILICSGAFIIGLFLGAVLHKGIVMGITSLLTLTIDNSQIPLFNINSIIKTACLILLVVFVMMISNARFLLKSSLMDLIRFEKSAEKKVKFRKVSALFGFMAILMGYVLALDILRGSNSLWITLGFYTVGMLTLVLVVVGTALFIAAFLPYAVQKSKKNKKVFYTEDKIITVPNFIYRIRSNSKTLIMLTLLSAATLTISSVMALSLCYPIAAISRIAPSEIELRIENDSQIEEVKQIIGKYVTDDKVTYTQTDIFKVTSSANQLPMEYSVGTSKGDSDNEKILRSKGFECISYSDYITLLNAQGKQNIINKLNVLQDNECILVKYQPNNDSRSETGSTYPLIIGDNTVSLLVRETTLNNPIAFANSVGTLIVSDNVYELIKANAIPETKILSINSNAIENNEKLYNEIDTALNKSPYLQGNSHRVNEIFSLSSSTFLLIGFLVILFFIATGSILYFNNVSAVSDSKADYEILWKMGYSNKKIKKIVKGQVFTFFFIPFIFGLLDCVFATLVYKTGLMQNLLGNSLILFLPSLIAIALTAFIYMLYYWLTVHTCCKTIFK